MRTEKFSAAKLAATLLLITALISGCGGGETQSNDSQQSEDQASGEEAKKEPPQESGEKKKGENASATVKIALGDIGTVQMDKRKFTLQAMGTESERQSFKLQKKVGITIDGKAGTPEQIQEGQQARLEYITKDGQNLVRSIQTFGGGEETTG